jgi:hypothetical protein
MTTAWLLSTLGNYATTVGALLIFLYLWRSPKFAEQWLTPEGKRAYAKHRRQLIIGAGLVAAWFILNYLAFIFT